ncbi:MAG: glycosyltransferase family 9 protein [Bacteroidales bacterium]|nr:glycosyltransferase family 9 protein [Bacteroidales bacterium]
MSKFLIIRFSSIGDIVLTTPVVRCLKQQVRGAEVHYLTKPSYRKILENNPYIDRLHLLSDDFGTTVEALKAERFDYIIDLHHSLRSLRLKCRLWPVRSVSFNKLDLRKWLYVKFGLNLLPDVHIVDRYMATVKRFGVTDDGGGLDYFIAPEDEVTPPDLPLGYIAVVLGAQHATKRLPKAKLVEICEQLPYPVILLGGKEDAETGEYIARSAVTRDGLNPRGCPVINAAGKYNLSQSASLVRQARAVLAHDTGLMHIAAAFRKRIVSVWGNTVPAFGMYPYRPAEGSVCIGRDLPCRPCSKIGYEQCPRKHFACMETLDVEDIVKALLS